MPKKFRIDGLDIPSKVIQTDADGNMVASDYAPSISTFTPTIAVIGSPTGFTYNGSGSSVTVNMADNVVTVDYVINGTVNTSSSPFSFTIELTNANAVAPNIAYTRQLATLFLTGQMSNNNVMVSLYWSGGKLRMDFLSNSLTASSLASVLYGQITYIAQ